MDLNKLLCKHAFKHFKKMHIIYFIDHTQNHDGSTIV